MTELTRPTVLVVDDTPASLYATSRVLRHAGFAVLEATTGESAIELAAEQSVDLIVLDINLPGMDGYEVCRRIRAHPSARGVRVVYLSASFVDDEHKVEGYQAGAEGFLTDPVEPRVLIATINAQLRTRAVERQLEVLLQRERSVREEAERANRAKDEFLATLSHELRSPLNAILGWAEVARLQRPTGDIEKALQVIVRNARFQTQLISDLLDVSRITTGKLHLELEPMNIADSVRAVVDTMKSSAEQRSIRIEASLDPSTGVIMGDPTRVEQIVSNLISNAIKFSKEQGMVFVTLERRGNQARISVRDQGQGLDPESLPRIFDRFWQADSSSRRGHSGLGLGLAIVKHLSEKHGGSVEAASEGQGQGATFTVTLPLAAPELTSRGDRTSAPESGVPDLTGMRIVIVDDDEDGRKWVRRIVVAAGAEAVDVGDVAGALTAVDEAVPDVLISDLAMPFQDGFDLLSLLRKQGFVELPVIAVSAFGSDEHKDRALEASFKAFLSKPVDPTLLLGVLGGLRRDVERS